MCVSTDTPLGRALLSRGVLAGHRSISAIARASGLARQTLTNAAQGNAIERKTANRLAVALGCSVDDLLAIGFVLRPARRGCMAGVEASR